MVSDVIHAPVTELSFGMLFLRTLLSLGIVLGLIGAIGFILRRLQWGEFRPLRDGAAQPKISVHTRRPIGRNTELIVVEVDGDRMLLSVGPAGTSLLSSRKVDAGGGA